MEFNGDTNAQSLTASIPNQNSGNKRKRKSTSDDTDIENQRPPPKRVNIQSPIVQDYVSSDTQSSSDCYSVTTEYDQFPLSSPPSIPPLPPQSAQQSVNSPLDCLPILSSVQKPSWHRGDTTPHATSKFYNVDDTVVINGEEENGGGGGGVGVVDDNNIENDYFNSLSCCVTPASEMRLCPLPALSWAEAKDVWKFMCRKDEKASLERDSSMLSNHPGLQPRMRAILLDWLIEVCEVYKLHRETYYLAVDYLDRFLSSNVQISKTRLQLIGITCLFIAAKVEEIYPPKIGEFAYVTDGACHEEDIIQQELILLTALNWSISPVTIIGWLSVYMQLHVSNRTPKTFNTQQQQHLEIKDTEKQNENHKKSINDIAINNKCESDEAFIYPQFSGMEFSQAAQLIDLCTLDLGLANYSYSVISAAAICHTFSKSVALKVSGLDWAAISSCVKWMKPFFEVIREEHSNVYLLEQNDLVKSSYGLSHICPNIINDDSHIIQTHTTSLAMFDKAMIYREKIDIAEAINKQQQEASPAPTQTIFDHTTTASATTTCNISHGLLTPPASNRKFLDNNYSKNLESGQTSAQKLIGKNSTSNSY